MPHDLNLRKGGVSSRRAFESGLQKLTLAVFSCFLAVFMLNWPYNTPKLAVFTMKLEHHKKSQLLSTLRQQEKPVSLSELLRLLGSDYAERSVRRWLSEMIQEKYVEKIGQKRGTHYQAIISTSESPVFSSPSRKSILYIKQPLFERNPVVYNKTWIKEYQPNQTYYLSHQQRKTLHSQGERNTAHDPAGTFARKIYNRLLIDLSYNSSRLEGNTYSLLETEKLVMEGVEPTGKLDEEKIMILNHKEAIRYLIDNIQKMKINFNEICTLHYLLSDALVPPQYSGKIRDHAVRISSSTYTTLENPQQLRDQLEIIYEKSTAIKDPFEQSFFLLVHIAYLQAFTDVNKRTARLSANIPLVKNNLVPLSFNSVNKDDYISSMMVIYELNDTRPLADLYCFSYARTCHEYTATIETIGFDEIRVRFREQRRNVIRNIIVMELTEKKLKNYIEKQTKKWIPQEHQAAFKKNIQEDLNEINFQRGAGMGVTRKQLQKWLSLRTANG